MVSLQPSATVTLRDLNLLERVVACTKYCADVCPEVADGSRLIVADSWTAQTEQILAAHPDLVLASYRISWRRLRRSSRPACAFWAGAADAGRYLYRYDEHRGNYGRTGSGSGNHHTMQSRIDRVRQLTTDGRRARVFCEEWGKPIIASQPWVAELVEAAGGEFVGAPAKTTTAGGIAAAEPDVILAAWCGAGDRVPLEKIVEQRHWQELPAVSNHRVFCINDELLNTPASSWPGGWMLSHGQFIRSSSSGRGGLGKSAVSRDNTMKFSHLPKIEGH